MLLNTEKSGESDKERSQERLVNTGPGLPIMLSVWDSLEQKPKMHPFERINPFPNNKFFRNKCLQMTILNSMKILESFPNR